MSTVLWINEHRTHTGTHISKLVHCQCYLFPNHFDIEMVILTEGGGQKKKKKSLSISLFNSKPPVAFGSLSKSLFHPGDSTDKTHSADKGLQKQPMALHSCNVLLFFSPPYKSNISKASGFAKHSVKNGKGCQLTGCLHNHLIKNLLYHFILNHWLLCLPNFQIRQAILLL